MPAKRKPMMQVRIEPEVAARVREEAKKVRRPIQAEVNVSLEAYYRKMKP